ncbi:MAG: hypothetical protein U0517_01165 [Candidatus Andersenbacteria bacterium]
MRDGREAMRDKDRNHVAHTALLAGFELPDGARDGVLGDGVEAAGSFVKNQQGWIA